MRGVLLCRLTFGRSVSTILKHYAIMMMGSSLLKRVMHHAFSRDMRDVVYDECQIFRGIVTKQLDTSAFIWFH